MKMAPKTNYVGVESEVDLLEQSYSLFELTLTGIGRLGLNECIRRRIKALKKYHSLDRDYLLDWIYNRFKKKKDYLKYDPKRSSLPTFIGHYTNYALLGLIQSYDSLEKRFKEMPENFIEGSPPRQRQSKSWLEQLERAGVEGVIDYRTPEDYYFAKELFGLMVEFFDPEELLIMLGFVDIGIGATVSGIEYQALCKRIQRKKEAFKPVLAEAGYL